MELPVFWRTITLAGSHFFNLSSGSVIALVYGDGSTQYYQVSAVMEFQALSPYSPYSNFMNLANPVSPFPVLIFFIRLMDSGMFLFFRPASPRK